MILQVQPRRSAAAGILLVECIVYIGVFMVILSLAFMALHRTWKTCYLVQRNANDVAVALHAGEQWRSDIRAATGAIEVGDPSADWLLRIHSRRGPIVYRLVGENLERTIPGQSHAVLLTGVRSLAMAADRRREVAAWRWELELKSRNPRAKLRPLFTFIAVAPPAQP